ncbi:MAG: choice-of-anchor A family protein [Bryobacteraceae bacterium]
MFKTIFALCVFLASSPMVQGAPVLNGFIIGNLTATAGDVEGNLLVSGNFSTSGTFGGIAIPVVGFPLPAATVDTLIVGGNLSTTSAWGMAGNAVYGGTLTGGPSHNTGTTRQQSPIQIDSNANAVTSGGTTIAALAQQWRDTSIAWSQFANSAGATISYSGGISLTGTNSVLNVFNLDSGHFNTASFLGIDIDVPFGATVIVNIPDTVVSVPSGAVFLNGASDINVCAANKNLPICSQTQRVIFNFFNATGFASAQTGWNGSIIAPFTTSATLTGGGVNGAGVFGGDVTQQGGWEFHNFPLQSDLPSPPFSEVPEPGSLLLCGAGLACLIARCMRAATAR